MIDTDRYKGHTPAPWVWMEWNTWLAGGNEDAYKGKFLVERPIEVADEDKVDRLLIADAPLLLQEVKRLRRVIEQHVHNVKVIPRIDISFDPKHNEEDEVTLYEWLDATSQGYWGSVYEYKEMMKND